LRGKGAVGLVIENTFKPGLRAKDKGGIMAFFSQKRKKTSKNGEWERSCIQANKRQKVGRNPIKVRKNSYNKALNWTPHTRYGPRWGVGIEVV